MGIKKILITGANGYLGAQICQYLSGKGYNVSGLCFPEIPDNEQWKNGFENIFVSDIRDAKKLKQIAEHKFDAIIHLVSLNHHQSNGEPSFVSSVNVTPVWDLLALFSKNGLKKFIYFSTIHVYGKNMSGNISENHPVNCANFYALTHYLSENICCYYAKNSDVDCVVVRLSNSYGEPIFTENDCWWLVVNDLCKMAVEQKKIILQSDGTPLRDFINGKDVCKAVKTLIDKGENGEIYHISSGETFSILELAHKVQKIYKKLYNENLPILKAENSNSIVANYKIENTKLKKLGFLPDFSLEKGIENLFNYLNK
jgi:UDP-glucose 4-epimerase